MNFKDLFSIKEKLETFKEELKYFSIEVQSQSGSKIGIREGTVYFNLAQEDWQKGVLGLELILQNMIQQLLIDIKTQLSKKVKETAGIDIGL